MTKNAFLRRDFDYELIIIYVWSIWVQIPSSSRSAAASSHDLVSRARTRRGGTYCCMILVSIVYHILWYYYCTCTSTLYVQYSSSLPQHGITYSVERAYCTAVCNALCCCVLLCAVEIHTAAVFSKYTVQYCTRTVLVRCCWHVSVLFFLLYPTYYTESRESITVLQYMVQYSTVHTILYTE